MFSEEGSPVTSSPSPPRDGQRRAREERGRPRPIRSAPYPDASGAPSRGESGRTFPGIEQSLPFLFVGGAALAIGLYLLVTRSPAAVGHIPLTLPAFAIGAVLVLGGIVGALLPEEESPEPTQRDWDPDLIRVPRSEWEEVRERLAALSGQPVEAPGSAATPTPRPTPSMIGRMPEPWDESAEPWAAGAGTSTSSWGEPRRMLRQLEGVARDLESRTHSAPRSVDSNEPQPNRPLPAENSETVRTVPRASPSAEVEELKASAPHPAQPEGPSTIRSGSTPGGGPYSPGATPSGRRFSLGVNCASCGKDIEENPPKTTCLSCGRPICPTCRNVNLRRWQLAVCADCALLLEVSGASPRATSVPSGVGRS